MHKLIARHSVSGANDKNSPAFGQPNANLLEAGEQQARKLDLQLRTQHNVVTKETTAATSELVRTQQTARVAGFTSIKIYPALNEVTLAMRPDEIYRALETKIAPKASIDVAETLLEKPPEEYIWITHGLVIAGLCHVLGVSEEYTFIPKFCEIRELHW